MKPGIQERERECGECKECLECSLGLLEISNRIPRNVIIVRLKEMFKKFPENLQQDYWDCLKRFREMYENTRVYIFISLIYLRLEQFQEYITKKQ